MKKIVLLAVFAVLSASATYAQQVKPSTEKVAVLTWKKTEMELGKVTQGKPVTAEFAFTNTGKAPLTITSVAPSCGCTTGDYTKTAVEPGKTGFVKLIYNAANAGPFHKSATITSNSSTPSIVLTIKGEVEANTETVKPQ